MHVHEKHHLVNKYAILNIFSKHVKDTLTVLTVVKITAKEAISELSCTCALVPSTAARYCSAAAYNILATCLMHTRAISSDCT